MGKSEYKSAIPNIEAFITVEYLLSGGFKLYAGFAEAVRGFPRYPPSSEMNGFTDFEPPRREVPVRQCYDDTLEGLESARNHMDLCSRSLVNCYSSAESSNEQFLQARSELTMLATVYMDMQFPLAVKVVKDLKNVFFLYNKYDVKKFKKNKGAMEEWITKHTTSSAILSKVQNLLLSDLARLRLHLEKTLESIRAEGERKVQECTNLRAAAKVEKSKFDEQKLRCDADKRKYDAERDKYDAEGAKYDAEKDKYEDEREKFKKVEEMYDAERARYDAEKRDYDAELGTYKAQETKYEDQASSSSREKADAESAVAAGLGLLGGGVVMTGAAVAVVAAAPVVVAAAAIGGAIGGVGVVAGAGMTAGGYHARGKAEGFKKEAEAKQETARKNGERVAKKRDIAVAEREEARKKKEVAMKKAKVATAKARKAAAKRKEAIANAEKAVAHGKKATANAERAEENAKIALREGNQAADKASREATQCVKAVELMKSDMPNSLALFIKAMEKVSQFHQGLSSDVDSSLEQVRGMDRMEEHFTLFRIYMDRIIQSCDSFERFQVIVRSRVDILPFLDGTDALAISQDWISKHEERGKLLPHESQNIREVTFPAQFPALTKHGQPWHKRVVNSAVRPFKHLGRH